MNEIKESYQNGIAVIGMAGRFPGSPSIDTFRNMIIEGREGLTQFSDDELLENGVPRSLIDNPSYIKCGPIMEGTDQFDAKFFGLTPREALATDPQHRLLWECSWTALERSGYAPNRIDVPAGVFVSCSMNYYFANMIRQNPEFVAGLGSLQTLISSEKDFIATRLSYLLNLHGPAIAVQTGCSSSLVAIHYAMQSLLNYECDMALAGGSSVRVPQKTGYLFQEGDILSRDGHCRPFDTKASGTTFGEGVGVVVLKRMEDALRDNDSINAVILGSATNNDGNRKVGYTAPSIAGQAECIITAMKLADVTPEETGYVECHGTGTPLGDPIEVRALKSAFSSHSNNHFPCSIGSVKANIGHLDAASGIAGFIKTIICLKNRIIPPCTNFTSPNPELHLSSTPFKIPSHAEAYSSDKPFIAGVSSFGIGGTNAHVVIQEYVENRVSRNTFDRPFMILPFSAKSAEALQETGKQYETWFDKNREFMPVEVANTLVFGRAQLPYRSYVVCSPENEAFRKEIKKIQKPERISDSRRLIFMFPGQGAQFSGMFASTYKNEPIFKREVDACAELLLPVLSLDIRDFITVEEEFGNDRNMLLAQTTIAQPVLFTVEYALCQLLKSWNIEPAAMVGHSLGEYVAAAVAGVFDRDTALRIVAARGSLMQRMAPGAMVSLELSPEEIRPLLGNDLDLALINGPSSCVVAGPFEAVKQFEASCLDKKITTKRLHTSHAFHSRMMDGAVDELVKEIKSCSLNKPSVQFISNASGTVVQDFEVLDPLYWGRQLRSTVRFADCIKTIYTPGTLALEVGPGMGLRILAMRNGIDASELVGLGQHPTEKRDDCETVYNAIGTLWSKGIPINWNRFYQKERNRRIPMPTYPFQRSRYWIDADAPVPAAKSVYEAVSDKNTESSIPDRNRVRDIFTKTWCEMLGVQNVKDTDDFFQSGGHSLLASHLFAALNKKLGVNIPLSLLFQNSTYGSLISEIEKVTSVPKGWASLVPMRSSGTRPPLFLIHGAEGNILLYRDLLDALPSEQPVYGLQSRGLDGTSKPLDTIKSMADAYVQEITEKNFKGPILLCGYCLGGAIALEMARKFQKMGRKVSFLAMIETYNPAFYARHRTLLVKNLNVLQNLYFHFRNITDGGNITFLKRKSEIEIGRLRLKIASLVKRFGLISDLNSQGELPHMKITRINDTAFFHYCPEPYNGSVTVFRPFKSFYAYADKACGWDVVATNVNVEIMKVYPRGMLSDPFVQHLANRINSIILETLEKESFCYDDPNQKEICQKV